MQAKHNMDSADPVEVLLTDGSTRASLAVARSFASHGVSFAVLCPQPVSLTRYSRFVKFAVQSPHPAAQPSDFARFVLQVVRKHAVRLVVPITDQELIVLNQHRAEFEPHTTLAMASSEAVEAVLDKRRNLALARQLGVPCPREFRLEDRRHIPEMIRVLGFPIVLKKSRVPLSPDVPQFRFKYLYAYNEAELRAYIDQYCMDGEDPLLQECATGEVRDLCCFASRGEVLALHEYHAIRRFNGSAILRRIVRPTPDLVEHTRNLLAAYGWDGVAHVSFFVGKDGRRWYMETNGRFWASVEGSVKAGWDFPWWTYEYFLRGRRPQPPPIDVGSRTCWHAGDLLALLKFLAGKGEVPTPGANPRRLQAIVRLLSGFSPAIHWDLFRWDDPLPALVELWPYFARIGQTIKGNGSLREKVAHALFPACPSSPPWPLTPPLPRK